MSQAAGTMTGKEYPQVGLIRSVNGQYHFPSQVQEIRRQSRARVTKVFAKMTQNIVAVANMWSYDSKAI